MSTQAAGLAALGHAAKVLGGQSQEPLEAGDIDDLSKRFQVEKKPFHFPPESFLGTGYAPPGGYVKDFSVIRHRGRWHLFHIDGRPEERADVTGNEVSFGHASTADFQHWVRHRMPLGIGDRPWENEHVWAPFVTSWRDRFYMFYMAAGRNTPSVITYAVSDDLETWTKWKDGPVREASGRDPFVRYQGDLIYLYYTANAGGIEVVTSTDMIHWSAAQKVVSNPARMQAESSSVHLKGNRWVLWYNDYVHLTGPTGDFRPVYVFSEDPLRFDYRKLNVFDFRTPHPVNRVSYDWVEKAPIPVSIELMEQGKDTWLVCYFRWHDGKFRLFFGALDWTTAPARIEEITTPKKLQQTLARVGMQANKDATR